MASTVASCHAVEMCTDTLKTIAAVVVYTIVRSWELFVDFLALRSYDMGLLNVETSPDKQRATQRSKPSVSVVPLGLILARQSSVWLLILKYSRYSLYVSQIRYEYDTCLLLLKLLLLKLHERLLYVMWRTIPLRLGALGLHIRASEVTYMF